MSTPQLTVSGRPVEVRRIPMPSVFAFQQAGMWMALIVAVALFAGLLIPYLFEEIHRGKVELGPNVPAGAGDTHPGWSGNPTPGEPIQEAPADGSTLSLRSFHLALIWLSIVLASGTGVWGLMNNEIVLGALSLAAGLLLIGYASYFARKAESVHLK
jgi:hypothetical protein